MWKDMENDDELIQEYAQDNDIEPYTNEAYEYWAVTGWFASKLEEKGEIVGELCGFNVWGRCTTGQSISLDCVVQKIAQENLS